MTLIRQLERVALACPFFVPVQRIENGTWPHPSRLPLGWGWNGTCSAPGHQGAGPSLDELHNFCNLGYAAGCKHLPAERKCDAVRFGVLRERGSLLDVTFILEAAHAPVEHGVLEYDLGLEAWTSTHPDPSIQKMAECYLDSYLRRRTHVVSVSAQ